MTAAQILSRLQPLTVLNDAVYDATGARLPINSEQVIRLLVTRLRKLQTVQRRAEHTPPVSLRDTLADLNP